MIFEGLAKKSHCISLGDLLRPTGGCKCKMCVHGGDGVIRGGGEGRRVQCGISGRGISDHST